MQRIVAILLVLSTGVALRAQEAPRVDKSAEAAYVPMAGDIVLFRHNHPLSRVFTAVTLSGKIIHVAIVVPRADGSMCLLETPKFFSSVCLNDVSDRVKTYPGEIYVRRHRQPLTAAQRDGLTKFAYAQEGKPYDWVRCAAIPFSLPVPLVKGQYRMSSTDGSRWYCASLVLGACCASGLLDPETVIVRGSCADDLRADYPLDLSAGWEPAVKKFSNP